ncbi:hypothetical protein ACWD04_29855 [Streptomyces sp. NPDC002911]
MLVVKTMALLAGRLPAARTAATAWLGSLADDTTLDSDIRRAALVHRTGCVPESIGKDTVPTAIDLLRRLSRYSVINSSPRCDPRRESLAQRPRSIQFMLGDLGRIVQVVPPLQTALCRDSILPFVGGHRREVGMVSGLEQFVDAETERRTVRA